MLIKTFKSLDYLHSELRMLTLFFRALIGLIGSDFMLDLGLELLGSRLRSAALVTMVI